jgi:hypothetical protein
MVFHRIISLLPCVARAALVIFLPMSPIEDTVISRQDIRKYIKRYLHLQEVLGKKLPENGAE